MAGLLRFCGMLYVLFVIVIGWALWQTLPLWYVMQSDPRLPIAYLQIGIGFSIVISALPAVVFFALARLLS